MVQLTLAPVRNENLFTKHYLEERVKNLPEWQEEEIQEAFEEIKNIYERKKSILSSCNEAQLRSEFINPVLENLGFYLGVEAPIQHSAKQPDYALFKKEEDKMEAYQKQESEDFYQKSVAVADAKAWGVDFDKKTGEENVFENRNPSFQIYYYLDSTPPEWGFLTNGKKWRLYYDEIGLSQWFETYYEVDLIDIIEKDDLESFKYFYLFFRKDAFTPVGDSFLDQAYQGSERYAQEIGENLEDNVYKALRWMAKGYFDMGSNNLEKSRENVEKVHEKSLIFLYRLIFLLYAESNGLLESGGEIPPKYSKYSVYEWAEELLEEWDNDRLDETGGLHYYKLSEIFKLVREGSEKQGIPKEEFHIPAYNGGLFDNQKHPFFDNYKIQDGNLAKVVDLLLRTYSEEAGEKVWVDYSDLSLRHLGGIYEGLLEHQLEKAPEDLVAEGDSKTGKWIPASEASKDFSKFDKENRKQEGELYLRTDKGERKATGSYYTPDYIVKYIVENTVGPVIEEKLEDAENDEEKRKAILSTNVLDPAMGSGHFLVEAIDFLSSRLVEFVENGGQERDIDWAKRKVARNCIYGVDINPLATELAKVSLWLNTMAEDKPLSFLDHHLKSGNSLIGADLHKLDKHPEELDETPEEREYEQQTLYGKSFQDNIKELLNLLKEIGDVTEESPEDIREQEKLLREFESHPFKKKFDVLADVQTSYYFGNEFSKKDYSKLLDVFRVEDLDNIVWEKLSQREWVRNASDSVPEKRENNLSDKKKFFHWKLEFPGIFFDIEEGNEKNNPGFDAVVGNPPYVSNWSLTESDSDMPSILEKLYPSVTTGHWDLFVPFTKKSIELTKRGGRHAFIVPTSFAMEKYGRKLRNHILKNTSLENVVRFGEYKAFGEEIDRLFLVYVIESESKSSNTEIYSYNSEKGAYKKVGLVSQDNFLDFPNNTIRPDITETDLNIREKISSQSVKLGNICCVNVGVVAHSSSESPLDFSKDDVIFKDKKESGLKKYLEGSDISRYKIDWKGEYIDYESKKEHFHRPKFEELFESEKIMITRVSGEKGRISSCLDRDGFYTNDNVIHTTLWTEEILEKQSPKNWEVKEEKEKFEIPYITGLLNSALMTYYFTKFYATDTLQGTYSGIYPQDIRNLPLANPELVGKDLTENLSDLVEKLLDLQKSRNGINLNLPDYLGNYSKGQTLGELYIPISGVSDTVLTDTKTDRDNLKLARVEFKEENGELILKASAKYKPGNEDEFDDLDRWGYTETNLIPAMKFSGSEEELALIREFTKLAVDEAGGFANFREKATKTNSLIDRLEKLTLPKLEDVKSGLEKYLEQKEKAERLEKEIQETDNLIDAIVFDLYDLTEDEVKTVLDSLDTKGEVREDILDKFREVNN